MTEFWNNEVTEASWLGLRELRKEIDFVLIGGWAIYLYSKLQKSRDIDIVVDYGALSVLKSRYTLNKNERLRKYEIKKELYDIDIYLPGYSELAVPPKDILSKHQQRIEGFGVATPEALLALKLGAASDRLASAKGEKDAIDILGLLFRSKPDLYGLKRILLEYKHREYLDLLVSVLNSFDKKDLKYLGLNESNFSKLKRRYLEEIKKIR